MNGSTIAVVCHTLVCVALIVAFTLTGNELVLSGLFGYLGGAGVHGAAKAARA